MTEIRPVDLPEIRNQIIAWLDEASAAELWYKMAAAGHYDWVSGRASTEPSTAGSVFRGAEILRLQNSTLFYVAADMVELATVAARSIPDFQLAPEDLPSEAGFMAFERPIASSELGDAEVGITAVCWARIPGRSEAVLGSIYFLLRPGRDFSGLRQDHAEPARGRDGAAAGVRARW
ncbi:hypothetical protein [Amycolatopsis sp. FDAARGOS 1241]|uniref:hypothetical protein n=1 Tax=Amycolatopsis sp. FDAARGOS 1241 TaxID=2778070 RepID=UPI00194F70BD|nr:hypothetical protein [Amycolatopsis sp. FDAARGOS 1241]QRP49069.1 hypothetical protein I6J71_15485 [Amycolatopsis sp. FDAARGOS 1241]